MPLDLDIDRFVDNLSPALQLPCPAEVAVSRSKTQRFRDEIFLTAKFGPKVVPFTKPFPLGEIHANPITLDIRETWIRRDTVLRAYLDSMDGFFRSKKFVVVLGNVPALKAVLANNSPLNAVDLQFVRISLMLKLEHVYESLSDYAIPLQEFGLLAQQIVNLWTESQQTGGGFRRFF